MHSSTLPGFEKSALRTLSSCILLTGLNLLFSVARDLGLPLYPGREETPVSMEQEVGLDPDSVWLLGRRNNLLFLPGIEPRTLGGPAQTK